MNRVAAEVGLLPGDAPFNSEKAHFIQMRYLVQTAGEELNLAHPWGAMKRTHSFVTDGSGEYDLPDDYLYMIAQTGWDENSNRPLGGPLTAQEWTFKANYLTSPIRALFRLQDGKMTILEDGSGNTISYEYQTRCWVATDTVPPVCVDAPSAGTDIPMFDRTLFTRYVKMKWQDAKGFDSTKAQDDFNQMFAFLTSKDKSAKPLDAGRGGRGVRLLDGHNLPDTGFGF